MTEHDFKNLKFGQEIRFTDKLIYPNKTVKGKYYGMQDGDSFQHVILLRESIDIGWNRYDKQGKFPEYRYAWFISSEEFAQVELIK